jgi:excisionase family DNA binding protein
MTMKSVSTVPKEYNLHPSTIRRWIAAGRLKAYTMGPRSIRIDTNDVAALLKPIGGNA